MDGLYLDTEYCSEIDTEELRALYKLSLSIMKMAEKMNLDVVAEGVETRGQLNFLVDMGCNRVQGYFFSRPVLADRLGKIAPEKKLENLA